MNLFGVMGFTDKTVSVGMLASLITGLALVTSRLSLCGTLSGVLAEISKEEEGALSV